MLFFTPLPLGFGSKGFQTKLASLKQKKARGTLETWMGLSYSILYFVQDFIRKV